MPLANRGPATPSKVVKVAPGTIWQWPSLLAHTCAPSRVMHTWSREHCVSRHTSPRDGWQWHSLEQLLKVTISPAWNRKSHRLSTISQTLGEFPEFQEEKSYTARNSGGFGGLWVAQLVNGNFFPANHKFLMSFSTINCSFFLIDYEFFFPGDSLINCPLFSPTNCPFCC